MINSIIEFSKLTNPTEEDWLSVVSALENLNESAINSFFDKLPLKLKNEKFYLKAIKEHSLFFKYLMNKNQATPELIKKALKANGQVLELIPEDQQTVDLVRLAMKECVISIGYSKIDLPEELYLQAIDQDPTLIEAVPDDLKTLEICLRAVKLDGSCLNFINEQLQTPEICLAAIRKYKMAAKMVEILPDTPHDQREQALVKMIDVKNNKQIIKQTIESIK